MTIDLEAIRQRNRRRNPVWSPAAGDTVTFSGKNSDDDATIANAVIVSIYDTHNFGRVYRIEQHVQFADYQVTNDRDEPVVEADIFEPVGLVSQTLRLYSLDADATIDEPIIEGEVRRVYAKHGDLFGHIAHDIYAEDWNSITLVDPSARDDIAALISEVEELQAKLLAT